MSMVVNLHPFLLQSIPCPSGDSSRHDRHDLASIRPDSRPGRSRCRRNASDGTAYRTRSRLSNPSHRPRNKSSLAQCSPSESGCKSARLGRSFVLSLPSPLEIALKVIECVSHRSIALLLLFSFSLPFPSKNVFATQCFHLLHSISSIDGASFSFYSYISFLVVKMALSKIPCKNQ